MAKEKERGEKKMFVGFLSNCVSELKILLTALLFLCIIATAVQFLPPRFTLSPSDLRQCLSAISSSSSNSSGKLASPALPPPTDPPSPPPLAPPPPIQQQQKDQILEGGIIKRAFNPYGAAAYNFILMSAYRGGLNTFAVLGLASKPLHRFGHPIYQCEWVPNQTPEQQEMPQPISTTAYKILPDWGYGRVYTVVVVNCTFPVAVGENGYGGQLLLHASTAGAGDRDLNVTDTIEALIEAPGSLNASLYESPAVPKYDYFYCGSSLYGDLSPERVREWIAYHVKFFGEKSHFVIHDAGGVHSGVLEVLKPWMEKGFVTLQDIREQERFDGYYHNQFLIVNDCLHRYRFMAKWMFFFDVDEYIYVPPKKTVKSVVDSLSEYSQFTIEQIPMSNKLCLSSDAGKAPRYTNIPLYLNTSIMSCFLCYLVIFSPIFILTKYLILLQD